MPWHNGEHYDFCGTSGGACGDGDCAAEYLRFVREVGADVRPNGINAVRSSPRPVAPVATPAPAPEPLRLEIITRAEANLGHPESTTVERDMRDHRVVYLRASGNLETRQDGWDAGMRTLPATFALVQRPVALHPYPDPRREWYIWAPDSTLSGGRFLWAYPDLKPLVIATLDGAIIPAEGPPPPSWYCAGCGINHTEDVARCSTCDWCAESCRIDAHCYDCGTCNVRHNTDTRLRCRACRNCESSCDCADCAYCGRNYSTAPSAGVSGCRDCYRCARCNCRCRGRACSIKFVNNPVDLERFRSTSFVLNRSRRMASCELEVAKGGDRTVDDVIARWNMTVKTDGSVDDGVEINTSPANGDNLVNQLTELASILNATKVEADKRCGYHLHVDARDYTWQDMRKAMLAWAHVEKEAYNLVPASRRENRYCNPRAEQIKGILDFNPALSSSDVKQRVMWVVADGLAKPAPGISLRLGESEPNPPTLRCIAYDPRQRADLIGTGSGGHRYCGNARADWERNVLRQGEVTPTGLAYWRGNWCHDLEPLPNECAEQYLYRARMTEIEAWKKEGKKRLFSSDIMRQTYPKRKRAGKNNVGGDRYYAFNVQSWFKYGTIEIRLHHGTVNRDKIVNWALLWTSFFDWCKVATLADIERFCKLDPWAALLSVAPSDDVRKWMSARRKKFAGDSNDADTNEVESDTSLGLSLGQPLPMRNWRHNATTLRAWTGPIVRGNTIQPAVEHPYTDTGFDDNVF